LLVILLANSAAPTPPVIQMAAKGPRTATKRGHRPPAPVNKQPTLNSPAVSLVGEVQPSG